jgi:hypothetical protein
VRLVGQVIRVSWKRCGIVAGLPQKYHMRNEGLAGP